MRQLTQDEQHAMYEFSTRERFIKKAPDSFWDDIASDGIDNANEIFLEIADQLERLAKSYRSAAE